MATGTIQNMIPFIRGALSSGSDLNDLNHAYDDGLYRIKSGVDNAPTTWTWMLVITGGDSGVCQIVFSSTKIYLRAYTGNPLAWTAWRHIDSIA